MSQRLYNKINKEVLRKQVLEDPRPRITLSFYQYAHIMNPPFFRNHFYILMDDVGVLGRIYIAKEGINGQLSVLKENWDAFRTALDSITFLKEIRLNKAIEDNGKSFYKLKIQIKSKIVADGLDDESFDVTDKGKHLSAQEFNEITALENTVIVDMRNHYESEVGHFEHAILPDVETFRESLPIVEEILKPHKEKNIVMYCTGGIRCEKASAYFKHRGFSKVHQLEGGIIEYARQAKAKGIPNKFLGKNFVFDDRLGEKISQVTISNCHQCGDPCDNHNNCANDACHILFIQCDKCKAQYEETCSDKCKQFTHLPLEDQEKLKATTEFNGTKFGKGRYKAHRKDHQL